MNLHGSGIAREWVKVNVSADTTAGEASANAAKTNGTCCVESCQWKGQEFSRTPHMSVYQPYSEQSSEGTHASLANTSEARLAHGYCLFPIAFKHELGSGSKEA